jgi:hypothetical protein
VLGVTDLAQRDVFLMPPAPALPAAAVARLPHGELGVDDLDEDPVWRLVAAFLVECRRAQTRRAYLTDLKAWYAWCAARDRHPLAAHRHDVALWARQLAEEPQASGKTAAPASIARRLSCLSSFYGYGVEVGVLEENPVSSVKRPRVAAVSMTAGLARDELEVAPERAARDISMRLASISRSKIRRLGGVHARISRSPAGRIVRLIALSGTIRRRRDY